MSEINFRPEYPRPQFVREKWQNLNGEWSFDFDEGEIGQAEHWYINHEFSRKINVPFVYQSKLSGVNDQRPIDCVWYERNFDLKYPKNGDKKQSILLNFGAVDYFCYVYVNSTLVGYHEGGSTPFSFDISQYVKDNGNKLSVCVKDSSFENRLPRGKQSTQEESNGIFYERVTGIWQTVWIEYLPEYFVIPEKTYFKTDSRTGVIELFTNVNKVSPDNFLELVILENGEKINPDAIAFGFNLDSRSKNCEIKMETSIDKEKIVRWDLNNPVIYDAKIRIRDGESDDEEIIDELNCYFAFRDITIEDNRVLLNDNEFFMRSLLYQGYFPDGLWTAPSDEAIKKDLQLTLDMGYNHLRLHQITADPRLLYWADKMGLTVWGEVPNAFVFDKMSQKKILDVWVDSVYRDRNHPSIIAWVPINESWGVKDLKNSAEQREFLKSLYYLTKSMDTTRPVIDNDGWEHVKTDLITVHIYKKPEEMMKLPLPRPPIGDKLDMISNLSSKPVFVGDAVYEGQPILITEWGGWGHYRENPNIKPSRKEAWGYGGILYENFDDVLDLYEGYIRELAKRKNWIKGHCYTEHTDQEQEVNGMLSFDRTPKCDLDKLKRINEIY